MPDPNLKPQTLKNVLHVARAAEGSAMFQHLFVKNVKTGQEFDALDGGDLSCAFFVSTVLTMAQLIDRPHATVETTLQKMQEAGWRKATEPSAGAVVYWPGKDQAHSHIGFYLGDNECVSNSSTDRKPKIHGLTLADGRQPECFYVHNSLHNPFPTDQQMV